jgi:isoquinoline 1-oxidoreductase alpha subunit
MAIAFVLNGKAVALDIDPETPLLWAVREELGLTGTKFGCGIGECGACTLLIDGLPTRSCSVPVGQIAGRSVTTIEAVRTLAVGRAVQAAWVKGQVPQCGYCQSGQIMAAVALLSADRHPSDAAIETAMDGHICRCGTYNDIRAAIKAAARDLT